MASRAFLSFKLPSFKLANRLKTALSSVAKHFCPQYNKLLMMMTSKHLQIGVSCAQPFQLQSALIDAQAQFIQSWLTDHCQQSLVEAADWLYQQPLNRYLSKEDVQRLTKDWLLNYPLSDMIRGDLRAILQAVIYHPINDETPLSNLIDDEQIDDLAHYISRHDDQRAALIHALIGNDTFADLLTKTLYHAINDFMENTLDKAGGVGKLMKMGRSSFERATNKNLDDKLQGYLHRNIKELSLRAEANANTHLSNEEVKRLVIKGWSRVKDAPASTLQQYLDQDSNNSIDLLESQFSQSFDRLRQSAYLQALFSAAAATWYDRHSLQSLGDIAQGLNIKEAATAEIARFLAPLIKDALAQPWFLENLKQMLSEFYQQPQIQQLFDSKA